MAVYLYFYNLSKCYFTVSQLKIFYLVSAGLSTTSLYFRENHFVNQRMSWTEAQSHCRGRFTDMVTIYNSDINQLLLTIVQNRNDITDGYWAWIGLYDNVYSWKWSMKDKNIDVGTTHAFLIWLKNQPNNLYTDQYCVVVQGQQSWMICPVEIVTLSCVMMVWKNLLFYFSLQF